MGGICSIKTVEKLIHGLQLEYINGRDNLGGLDVDGRLTLRCIVDRKNESMGTELKWLRIGSI
jgi:hypothetical protein